MSIFSLFGHKKSRTTDILPTHPSLDCINNAQTPPPISGRKAVRLGQRELLYTVVRDVMIRAGVLVASYRFKVLSLDAQGRQYLIMMDLLKVDIGNIKRLDEIESMIVQAAKVRHDLIVTGVYWRNELQKTNVRAPQPEGNTIKASELASRDKKADSKPKEPPRREIYPSKQKDLRDISEKLNRNKADSSDKNLQTPAHDFEDTRIVEPNEYGSQLSATQYGDLE